jgi:protein-tyrosine phosphatase
MPFVDLHAHILPGLDDGPATVEEAINMALTAVEDGTRIIVATPHQRDVMLKGPGTSLRQTLGDFNSRVAQEVATSGRRRPRLLLGMENHIEPELPEWFEQGLALTIAGTRFILVEPPFTAWPKYVDSVLSRLRMKRLVPVIAHPERNSVLQKDPSRLEEMIEEGMLTQVSAGSFVGVYGIAAQRSAESMMRQGLVHIVASDMHHSEGPRGPSLSTAFLRVARMAGEDTARLLFEEHPAMMLEGLSPEREAMDLGEPARRWWLPERARPRLRWLRIPGIGRGED